MTCEEKLKQMLMVQCVTLSLTFLHTAMRMMIEMMMMTTKARTAANTATWEYRAATARRGQTALEEEKVHKHDGNDFVKKVIVRLIFIT